MAHKPELVTTGTVGRALKMHVPKCIAARLRIPNGGGVGFLINDHGDIVMRRLPDVRPRRHP